MKPYDVNTSSTSLQEYKTQRLYFSDDAVCLGCSFPNLTQMENKDLESVSKDIAALRTFRDTPNLVQIHAYSVKGGKYLRRQSVVAPGRRISVAFFPRPRLFVLIGIIYLETPCRTNWPW